MTIYKHAKIARQIKPDVKDLNELLAAMIYVGDDKDALQDPCFAHVDEILDKIIADMNTLKTLFKNK